MSDSKCLTKERLSSTECKRLKKKRERDRGVSTTSNINHNLHLINPKMIKEAMTMYL